MIQDTGEWYEGVNYNSLYKNSKQENVESKQAYTCSSIGLDQLRRVFTGPPGIWMQKYQGDHYFLDCKAQGLLSYKNS